VNGAKGKGTDRQGGRTMMNEIRRESSLEGSKKGGLSIQKGTGEMLA